MSEHLPPDQEREQQRFAQSLVQSQAWKEIAMTLLLQRLAEHAHTAAQMHMEASVRLSAVDGQQELLGFVRTVYRLANVPNPFDADRLALWSLLRPPRPDPASAPTAAQILPARQRRYPSGGVA
jgi:hypothetical protein